MLHQLDLFILIGEMPQQLLGVVLDEELEEAIDLITKLTALNDEDLQQISSEDLLVRMGPVRILSEPIDYSTPSAYNVSTAQRRGILTRRLNSFYEIKDTRNQRRRAQRRKPTLCYVSFILLSPNDKRILNFISCGLFRRIVGYPESDLDYLWSE